MAQYAMLQPSMAMAEVNCATQNPCKSRAVAEGDFGK
jgi:hypothetical protein